MEIKKEDLLSYSYYDEQGKLIAILNVEKLKEILKVDEIRLGEYYE